jgi:hypothetical protein
LKKSSVDFLFSNFDFLNILFFFLLLFLLSLYCVKFLRRCLMMIESLLLDFILCWMNFLEKNVTFAMKSNSQCN